MVECKWCLKSFDVEILNSVMEGTRVAEQYFSAGLGL